jgi:GWxTD domain-containing protein
MFLQARRLVAVAFLVTSAWYVSSAQGIAPTEPLRIALDLARFRGSDNGHTMVELYYSFPRLGITYIPDSSGFAGAGDISVWVKQKDSVIQADRWLVPHTIRDSASVIRGTSLVGIHTFQVRAGEYQVKVLLRDRYDAKRRDSLLLRVPIRVIDSSRTDVSDIELATSIRQGSNGGTFYKNTLDVVPNVGGLYTEEQRCFYYAEAYNLLNSADRSDFTLRTVVADAVGKEVISRDRARKRVGESSVIVDQFSAENLRSGTYQLTLVVLDSSHKPLASSARKFFVYNSHLGVDSSLLTGGMSMPMVEYMSMDEAELDRESRWCKYEMSEAEKGQFGGLKGVEPKRKFLSDFWRRRPIGLRDEYLARISYANANYQVLGREGYRSDRGRVYVVYGAPDDIERHPNETDMRPYEIWQYNNLQGGVIFVFVQKNSGGDYELVHSTHRNELRDDNWDRQGITR